MEAEQKNTSPEFDWDALRRLIPKLQLGQVVWISYHQHSKDFTKYRFDGTVKGESHRLVFERVGYPEKPYVFIAGPIDRTNHEIISLDQLVKRTIFTKESDYRMFVIASLEEKLARERASFMDALRREFSEPPYIYKRPVEPKKEGSIPTKYIDKIQAYIDCHYDSATLANRWKTQNTCVVSAVKSSALYLLKKHNIDASGFFR